MMPPLICLHNGRKFRPGPNKAHVAFHNVIELRKFIKAERAENFSDFGNARIIRGYAQGSRVYFERSEFIHHKYFFKTSHPFLREENRPFPLKRARDCD